MPHAIPPATDDRTSTANTLNGHPTVETSVQANLQMINIHTNRQLHLPVPHQLRPVTATFTDRTRMLREMARRLADQPRDSTRIISIGGVAGVGKTAFATRLLHDLSDEFPGGQLQVDRLARLLVEGPGHHGRNTGPPVASHVAGRAVWRCGGAGRVVEIHHG
ncbi:hypothetical protein GCM10009578_031820 [Streptomyces rhizosphaericus]